MTPPTWIDWTPLRAPSHITGRYTARVFDPETRTFDEQQIEAYCSRCNTSFKRACNSGRPREWIAKFAAVHRHE